MASFPSFRTCSFHFFISSLLIFLGNFHLFQPLLYQVATGGLSRAGIAAPLRSVLQKHRNTRVVLVEVVDFDPAAK